MGTTVPIQCYNMLQVGRYVASIIHEYFLVSLKKLATTQNYSKINDLKCLTFTVNYNKFFKHLLAKTNQSVLNSSWKYIPNIDDYSNLV